MATKDEISICSKILVTDPESNMFDVRFRVDAFLRERKTAISNWEICSKDQATHISCCGVCGAILRFDQVKVVGHLRDVWTPEHVREAEEQAKRLEGNLV